MKRLLESYGTFSRMERMGLIGLTVLLLLLAGIRATLTYWIRPTGTAPENERLQLAWESFRAKHLQDEGASLAAGGEVPVTPTLFHFDPNTLDSAGFRRLGLSARVVKGLMNWRRHGKKFYKKEDLKPLYNLTPDEYTRLEPYITISIASPYEEKSWPAFKKDYEPLPATIDLNTADSFTLVRLNGIGPTLARKIVARREALGGFLRHEQLLEVYRFPDTTFQMLRQRLVIRPETVRKMDLNTATAAMLSAHPYIGEKTTQNILLYREGLKRFDNVAQLRQVPLMNEEIYRKIAPYFTIE